MRSIAPVVLSVCAVVGLSGCSVFGGDDGTSDGPGKVTVDSADGDITADGTVPDVAGVDLYQPTDGKDAVKMLCGAAEWWMDQSTSPDDRKAVSPFLVSVSSDYVDSDDSSGYVYDVSDSVRSMVRAGSDVGDKPNNGQSAAVRSCAIGVEG